MKKYLISIFIILILPTMAMSDTPGGYGGGSSGGGGAGSTFEVAPQTKEDQSSTITVSGTVKTNKSEPLVGANVYPKSNPANGTASNKDGTFTIKNVSTDDKIVVSFTGYKEQTLSPSENMTISLEEDPQLIGEAIVVACIPVSPAKSSVYDMGTQKCYPTACESSRYILTNKRQVKVTTLGTPHICTNEEKCQNFCKEKDTCNTIEIGDSCEDQVNKECKPEDDPNAKTAVYTWESSQLICKTQDCVDGYEPKDGKCTAISGNCDSMPPKAVSAHRSWDSEAGKEVCIVDSCADKYRPNDDKQSCVSTLSEEDSEAKIAELQENADAMKEKEQSTANKLLGAASMGSMGIGGMQVASALAEQKADNAAEQDMTAYLATFKCDYGQGMNIQGGESNVALPGANVLLPLYNEYTTLAADLKTRKEALGMTPGIESEVILDAATSGLYDNAATGITDSAFTSLSRALTDENSDDAAEWATQRSDTASQLKTGAIVAGAGALVGIAGNLLINETGKDKVTERSDEIIAKYEPLRNLKSNVDKLPNNDSNAKCPSGTTGTYPECKCNDNKYVYTLENNSCTICPGDKVSINNICGCDNGTSPGPNDSCSISVAPKCNTNSEHVEVDPDTGNCSCTDGYQLNDDELPTCECPTNTHTLNENGDCVIKNTQTLIEQATDQITPAIELPTNKLFKLNSFNLTSDATTALQSFAAEVKRVMTDNNYCISVTGYTDKSGTDTTNITLSKNRADAVKQVLVSNGGINSNNIKTQGLGSQGCSKKYDPNCRKVEVKMSYTACQ